MSEGPVSPHGRRRRATEAKLREALDRLAQRTPGRLSVAALAREAGVGRSAIYANHRSMLDELKRLVRQHAAPDRRPAWQDKLTEQRAVIDALTRERQQLATENAALLKRALDAEARVADLQRRTATLLRQLDALSKPALLPSATDDGA